MWNLDHADSLVLSCFLSTISLSLVLTTRCLYCLMSFPFSNLHLVLPFIPSAVKRKRSMHKARHYAIETAMILLSATPYAIGINFGK